MEYTYQEEKKERLDKYLQAQMTETRSQIKKIIGAIWLSDEDSPFWKGTGLTRIPG